MQTFTGKEYLKIDIASNFGLDKKTWQARIDWFDQNQTNLEALVPQADKPALFYAGVKAWRDTEAGKPTGYMISLDATSSGLQLLAALTGDRKASELCNVVNTGNREDAYTGIYEQMAIKLEETTKINREQCKDAILTSLYGSTRVPKNIFGEGALLDVFYHTISELAPAAWDLNQTFLAIWDPNVTSHDWVLPDNFHVHVKVMGRVKKMVHFLNQPFEVFYNENMAIEGGRSLGANSIHSVDGLIVREITRRCSYNQKRVDRLRYFINTYDSLGVTADLDADDKMVNILWAHYKKTNYLSARILDHLNLDNLGNVDKNVILELIHSLPPKPFTVITIHDCFRVLANYGNEIRKQYALQLELIAKSDLLGSILSQITHKNVHIGKLDPTLVLDIPNTEYALS